ncbi:tail fiber domain-containing protein [Limosilactobacillus fermentum]|uniref:tail fiber domain-containing protein n=1 Tax=Limosilactobacillus fermentum TaxID=1613 RepID=UPI000C1F1A84|nr:tail fiber domain-containing protein [Limosilactobacillus fermentum]PJF07357.1 hypothetical protein CUJ85_01875 [Limosilactobacillus fermentum]QID93700.1 hypothetical protein GJA14_07660 [Limosilactobacillus fermentum]
MPMDNVTLENTQQSISSRDAKSVASVMVNGKWVNLSDTLEQANVKSDVGTVAKQVAAQQEVVSNAVSVADSAQSAADAAVASAQVTSDAVSAIASATAEAKQGANDALSRAKSAWDVATNAKSAVTDFDPLLKSAQSDASNAIAQIADTASALSDAKAAFTSDVAVAKNLASTAQTTADNAVKSASSVANDLTAVASQAKSNADGITKVTSDVGLLQTTVADNSGNISTIQETAKQIQQAVSDNAGNITVAKQTADSAATVASDARSNATVAIQTASQASITAKNASGQAASAVITASGAMTTASNAKSDATVAVQTASGASLTAINANSDATVAKQTASEAKVQASNAESDFAQLSIRAGQIEASVATNSGAIASVQQTANGLTTTVGKVDDRVKKIEDTTNWTTKTGALDMDTLTTTQNIYYRDTNLKNADGEAGWAYIQVVSTGERVTQTVWHDRSSIQHTRTGAIDGSTYDWDAWNKVATNAQVVDVKQSVDGISTIINDPKTGLNATYQTAAGNATTISNVKSDVYQLETTANGLTSRVGNLESKTNTQETAIEQNKNAITLKADQTDVDTVKGTVAGLQSSLTVQGNQIQTKVSASDVSGMLKGYATQDYTQSLVTQQANTLSSTITKVKNQVNSLESAIDWTTKTGALDMDTLTTTQNIYYRDTNLKNADGEAGWAYIQVVSMGERVTQTVWHDRSSIQHTRTGAVSGSSYNWDAWNRTATNAQISNLTQSLDGLRSTVATKADQSEVTQLSNLIQAKVSSGDFTSTTTQLKNMINQRVQVGDVISQINQEAGGNTLIQVSNGKGSLILNAANTVITGKAWIPVAAIADLTADQIQAGTLKGVKVDFRDSTGTGMIADGSTLTFDVSNTPAGYLSYNGMPVAELPDGSGGNELAIRYGLSTAIIPADNSGAQATFSKAAQKIAYMTGTSQGKQMLSGLEVHSNNHHWLCAVNSDATCNRFEVNDRDGLNIAWHDNTHFFISDGNAKLYQDNNDSQTATKLEIHGWAWVNGWVEAAGHSQHSTLSSKTRIEEADPNHMLDLVNNTELTTFAFKSEVAEGTEARHIGPIIDDVNDVAQYRMPAEFIAPTKTARDDDNMIGALFGAVQALTKRIKALESKVG